MANATMTRTCGAAGNAGVCDRPAAFVYVFHPDDGCDPGSMDLCAECVEETRENGYKGPIVKSPFVVRS